MADVLDFPLTGTAPDMLPEPDDAYQAFETPSHERFPMLMLVFHDGSMSGFRFDDIDQMDFRPAGYSLNSLDEFNLYFVRRRASKLVTVRIEGRNLLQLTAYVGARRTGWLRELPPGWQVKESEMPVITRILMPPGEA